MGLQNRGAMADVIAKTVRETCRLRSPEPSKPEIREAIAVELRDEGVCRLGALLDGDAVARTRAVMDKAPLSDAATGNRTFARDEALGSVNVGTVDERAGLSACEELLVAANHPSILAGVEAFLGAPPTVQYYTAWWSFAGRSAAREAQLFHYDRNCFRFVKLFIYLPMSTKPMDRTSMSVARRMSRTGCAAWSTPSGRTRTMPNAFWP